MGRGKQPSLFIEDDKTGQAAADASILVFIGNDQRKCKSGGFFYGFNKHISKIWVKILCSVDERCGNIKILNVNLK
ncbi:hypothetical protein D9M69_720710 [compost metagenome]